VRTSGSIFGTMFDGHKRWVLVIAACVTAQVLKRYSAEH
jgi:hypothetical protein